MAIFNISPSLYSPPFLSTFWMTSPSGWIFYPLQRVSTSTTSMADTYLTSVSIFSETISPSNPFSYQTVIIKKLFCIFSQSQLPWNNLHRLTLILLPETFQNKLGNLLCHTSANTWRWFPHLTGSTPSSFLLYILLIPQHFHNLQNQIPLLFPWDWLWAHSFIHSFILEFNLFSYLLCIRSFQLRIHI